MNPHKRILIQNLSLQLVFLMLICSACSIKKAEEIIVTNPNDYLEYLNIKFQIQKIKKLDRQIGFWNNKYKQDDRGFIYLNKMAVIYIKKFRNNGNINHVFASDSIYQLALDITNGKNKIAAYRGLSQNSILKHDFKKALIYADSALYVGANSNSDLLLKFDALMELGDTVFPNQMIRSNQFRDDFDFLTRKSKYLDQIGNLDSAILVMEVANDQMSVSNNTEMICWALSNLGDMYMHAGRVQESYSAYLKVLSHDPAYQYALKGIAWLAYSNDHKPTEAIRILDFLKEVNQMPDVYLMLAEIQEFMGRKNRSKEMYEKFYALSSSRRYQGMYNKYKILLNVEQFKDYEKALILCLQEQENRKTPEVYDLLAWTYFNMGANEKAYEICNQYVLDKSFEPELVFHSAKILSQNKKNNQAEQYYADVLDSKIEIGPMLYEEVLQTLN